MLRRRRGISDVCMGSSRVYFENLFAGKLKEGDQLLEVNGDNLEHVTNDR